MKEKHIILIYLFLSILQFVITSCEFETEDTSINGVWQMPIESVAYFFDDLNNDGEEDVKIAPYKLYYEFTNSNAYEYTLCDVTALKTRRIEKNTLLYKDIHIQKKSIDNEMVLDNKEVSYSISDNKLIMKYKKSGIELPLPRTDKS